MSLEITQREREGIVVLDLQGRITAGPEATAFREAFEKAAVGAEPKVVLNMKGVEYIDSTGLGALVMVGTQTKSAGGAAKLVYLNRIAMELLVMTKLDTIFEVFDDETDAESSFYPSREIRKFDILNFVNQLKEE